LVTNWTHQVATNFIRKLEDVVLQLADGKVQYKWFEEGQCFSVPITKHNTLYYDVVGETLFLLTVWDTRQDPTKLKL